MWRSVRRLWKGTDGAVAPTVALSLVGLIACGGIAFDYSRLATMDTELQQAADQAALAAATQLDRAAGSQDRATAAIQDADDANRLAANITKFANDGADSSVEIEDITFCSAFDDSVADTTAACTVATDDSDSRFVIVTTSLRTANYALTPIVGAMRGTSEATAVAGIQSSICNVAPLLVCVADDDFPTEDDIGKGIIMKVAGGSAWAPGNYGFLDFGKGNAAVIDALLGHGLNGCQATDDNETEPGNKNATDAINTRFDVYDGTGSTKDPSVCALGDGTGCPAPNTRKDMTLTMTFEKKQLSTLPPPTVPECGAAASADVTYTNDFALNSAAKGLPRDTCHYGGTCAGGNFGDADWDRAGYMAANHPGITAATVAAAVGKSVENLTRYDMYKWELDNKATGKLAPITISTVTDPPKVQGPNTTYKTTKQCAFSEPKLASAAYPEQKDRRLLPIVAANCDNLKGKGAAFEDYVLLRVFDIFLVEPSLQRTVPGVTDDKEIYGEVVGPAQTFEGGSGFQYYSRNRPYLIR